MVTLILRDGQKVTPWMEYAVSVLDRDFHSVFGLHVRIRSAIRTYEDQKRIFLERYVTAGNVRGRRVYDTRWWQGQLWYRISSAGTVAVPGTSNHEIQGSKAAVDLYDTGSDAGLTSKNSTRGRWVRDWCRRTGLMIASGDGFGEGWHFDIPGIFRTPPQPPAPEKKPNPVTPITEPTLEDLMALKSAVVFTGEGNRNLACAYDFQTGFRTDWQSNEAYARGMGSVIAEGGTVTVSLSHYNKIMADFDKFFAGQRAHELAVAKASRVD